MENIESTVDKIRHDHEKLFKYVSYVLLGLSLINAFRTFSVWNFMSSTTILMYLAGIAFFTFFAAPIAVVIMSVLLFIHYSLLNLGLALIVIIVGVSIAFAVAYKKITLLLWHVL